MISVAEQSLETGRYLNGYQAFLAKQLEAGQIDSSRFVEETHAILVELRFNNPKHLEQVERAQMVQLKKLGKSNEAVSLTRGVDNTLINLIPNVNSKENIDRHARNLKQSLISQGRPILPKRRFPLVA